MHQRHLLAAAARAVERIADDALGAVGSVEAYLGGDLVRSVLAQRAAGADIRTFGAFATHHEVDVLRALPGQRADDSGVELDRAEVDVMVHEEAEGQQHSALEHSGLHRRIADRTEQDRVVAAQLLHHRVRQQLTGGVVATGAEVVLGRGDREVGGRRHRAEDLDGLGHHLGSDAIAGDEGQVQGARHGLKVSWPSSPNSVGDAGDDAVVFGKRVIPGRTWAGGTAATAARLGSVIPRDGEGNRLRA